MPIPNVRFLQADGQALPFPARTFDAVLSHAVIEHVPDAPMYLSECARVLRPAGWMYLSTAPYLSFAGAHLPRLKVPIPLHLLIGRHAAFAAFQWLARHAPRLLKEQADQNSFIKLAREGQRKQDDLLEKVRVRRLRHQIAEAGFTVCKEDLYVTATFRRLGLARWLRDNPVTQDMVIGHVQYLLERRAVR